MQDLPNTSGFEDDTIIKSCQHPSHPFPGHLVIPEGKKHTHTCPGCGQQSTARSNQFFL